MPAMKNNAGFTLMELAIAMLIIALLIGGLAVPLSAQMDMRSRGETQEALSDIRDALFGFAVANGRLPCPASATTPSGSAGAGLEETTGAGSSLACVNASGVGVLPWATLGVGETDAWGNRYTYRVVPQFARGASGQGSFTGPMCPPPSPPQGAAFALCSQGNLTVGGGTVASNVPAVVVSHGRNGRGAYATTGAPLSPGADADELDNQLTGGGTTMANVNFASRMPTATFDDLVIWLSPNILFNRMIAAGRLP